REALYKRYVEKLSKAGKFQFQKLVASRYNYSYMPVCFENSSQRDLIYEELLRQGVGSRKYFYPLTVDAHYFSSKGTDFEKKFGLTVASDVAGRVLCLPLYPDLGFEAVDRIVEIIRNNAC